MKFRKLEGNEAGQRITIILSNLKISGLVDVFSEYFAKFQQGEAQGLGGWFQSTKS